MAPREVAARDVAPIEAAAKRPSLPPADAQVLERARGAPLTRDGISELAKVAADQLEASLIAAIDARDVKAATALALAILAAGGDLAAACVARLVPDVDQRDLVPSLLRGMRAPSDAERLEVMRQAIERGQLSHDREAIVAFVATRLLGDAPWPAPWPGILRTLARQRLGTEAGVLLGVAIRRSGDEAAKAIGAECIELADRSNADEVEQFWIDGWAKPVLEILPETEPPRVVVGYTVRKAQERPGRNDPCHCGSGKKYKKCHASSDEASDRNAESPLVDAARVTATDVEGMRIQEILALPWARLQRPALVRAIEQLRAYHRWEDAEAALEILAAQGGATDVVEELREHLIEEALRMRALDVLDRQLAKVKDRESQKEHVKAGIACARPGADTLRVLDEQARRGLEGDVDAIADVAYSLLDHAPALGILVGRGALDPARTLESDTILEEIEYARDRLGLPPYDAYGPLYDQWVEGREAEEAQAEAIAAELTRLKAELGRAEGEVEARQAQVVAMEHEIRDMRERLERQAVKDTAAGVPQSEALAAYRVAEEHRQRLARKVDELKALLAEGNAERSQLREQVAELESQRAERTSESAEMAAVDPDEGEGAAGVDEETMPVRVPVFTKKSLLAIADMPPKVQRAAVSSAGRLGAGERAAWRDVKRMQGMDAVWTARIGIHHRLIFTIGESELTVMDVVTREALLTSLERYR